MSIGWYINNYQLNSDEEDDDQGSWIGKKNKKRNRASKSEAKEESDYNDTKDKFNSHLNRKNEVDEGDDDDNDDDDENDAEYFVEKILDKKILNGVLKYKIKWKGWSDK